jgi:enoyl-CoA hydratase/carnithine racemase
MSSLPSSTDTPRVDPSLLAGNRQNLADHCATHFQWQVEGRVAAITLHRPERKNPLTFDSYPELRDLFGRLKYADDVKAVVEMGILQPPRRAPEAVLAEAHKLAREIADGPAFANGITKTMLHQEWAMTIEQAIEAEAQAQAICMLTEDFARAYHAFVAKQEPKFEGN